MPPSRYTYYTPTHLLHTYYTSLRLPTVHLLLNLTCQTYTTLQMAFACITPALVTGSMADRMKLSAFALWVTLWTLLVYPLIAHWGFSPGGWCVAHAATDIYA